MIQVVAAILVNEKQEVLIAKRKESMHVGTCWEFPGGKIEKGETKEEALIREIKEELDIEIKIEKFFDHTVYKGKDITIDLYAYKSKILSGVIHLKEHTQYVWINPKDLHLYDMTPADQAFVKKLQVSL